MRTSICTLFEGDYHLGLGALVNSLYAQGFRGSIWAGYRGELPPWAGAACGDSKIAGLSVAEGCVVNFVRLETKAHLTNIKPDFMLDVMDRMDPECEALCYVDPDIVVAEQWRRFEEWLTCGVAVCEDVNSPVPLHHPHRIGWRRFFKKSGITLSPRESCYANGGFVGLERINRRFLERWKQLQDAMWVAIGSAEFAGIAGGQAIKDRSGFFECFGKTDQDALNAAIEAEADVPVSFLDRQAMGFETGKPLLPHALGSLKPWRNRIIWNAIRGMGRPTADKYYWRFVEHPVRLYPGPKVTLSRMALKLAAAISRFIRRA